MGRIDGIERAFVSLAVVSFIALIAGVVALAVESGAMQKHSYRAFEIGEDGHVVGRTALRYCSNDEAAQNFAKALVDGKTH